MKLEQQCVSLELAKKLKQLGVKQESLWWWLEWAELPPAEYQPSEPKNGYVSKKALLESRQTTEGKWPMFKFAPLPWNMENKQYIRYSAFTVAELIEACGNNFTKLKRMVGNPFAYGNPNDQTVWWSCPYEDVVNEGATPQEAVGKMLIYLLENKLI